VLILATATILVACESPPATRSSSTPASGGRLATPFARPGVITDSPIPAAGGWVTYVNRAGEFTFSAPADWRAQSCEDSDGDYVVTAHDGLSPPPCGRGEYEDTWLFFWSVSGDQRPVLSPPQIAGTVTGTMSVVVDGVQGVRYTARVDRADPLPPPQGAQQIYYVFFNGRRTYDLRYDHWPIDPDRTADFDRLVQQTLRFSG
jgi:hypothetical protein